MGWVIYDKVAKIHYINEPVDVPNIGTSSDKPTVLFDASWGMEGHPVQKGDTIVKIFARFENDKEMSIIAGQSVYLCNDKGETIEKIN